MRRAAVMLVVWLIAVTAFGETGKPRADLNLRTSPSVRKGRVITVLRTTNTFEILETRRAWCRVRVTGTGTEGWVSKTYVELVPDAPAPAPATSGGGAATLAMIVLLAALLASVGYAASKHASSAATDMRTQIAMFIASFALGSLYIGLTLPKALVAVSSERQWMTVARLGEWSLGFNQRLSSALPEFATLMRYIVWAILLYLLSLLLLAVRHGQFNLFVWGAGALTFSVAVLHLLIWGAFIVAKIGMFVLWIGGRIGAFFRWILLFVIDLIRALFAGIYHLLVTLLGSFWWVVPAVLAIVLLVILSRSHTSPGQLFALAGRVLLIAAGASGALFALYWLWHWIEPWMLALGKFMRAAILFVAMLIRSLFIAMLLVVAVATLGQLLLDQVRGALSAGRRRRGIIIGAVAIGSSIAILLFISNLYGVISWLPSPATEFATRYLHQPSPLLDALIALGIVSLSVVGVWRNVPALGEEPTEAEFGKSMVYAVAGICFNGALVAIAGETET